MVVEEMKYLNKHYGKSLFVFNENSFNWSRARVEKFLQELGRSGMKVDFWFQSRVRDIVRDADLMPEFKRLGLYEVMLGVESINPHVLDHYQKRQNREIAQEAIDILRRNGIMVMTNVMFGDWYDSEESLKEIFDFVKRQGDFLVLTITTPLPGTRYYQEMEERGLIQENDYAHYDFMQFTKLITGVWLHPLSVHQTYTHSGVKNASLLDSLLWFLSPSFSSFYTITTQ